MKDKFQNGYLRLLFLLKMSYRWHVSGLQRNPQYGHHEERQQAQATRKWKKMSFLYSIVVFIDHGGGSFKRTQHLGQMEPPCSTRLEG